MITNDGDPTAGAGFFRLIITIWTLVKLTVGGNDDYLVLNMWSVPQDLQFAFDILLTFFRIAAVLLMINLLIAIIGKEIDDYS
jgi:hypothetical protein